MQYAGAWQRLSASATDAFILGLIVFVVSFTVFDPSNLLGDAGVAFVSGLIYSLSMGSSWQATAGMRRRRIYVVKLDGSPVGYPIAVCRYLAFSVPMIFDVQESWMFWVVGLFVKAIWYFPIIFDKEKAGIHDIMCNTRVVRGMPVV